MDADGASEISDLKKLYDAIKSRENVVPSLGSDRHGLAIGSR